MFCFKNKKKKIKKYVNLPLLDITIVKSSFSISVRKNSKLGQAFGRFHKDLGPLLKQESY